MAKKILVVDDEPDILKSVAFILKKSGYEVFTAEDGEVGLEMVKRCMPDLILLDMRLPGKDGMEVCRSLKDDAAYKHIPIILLTASTGMGRQDLSKCGYDSFVLKPFQYNDLLAEIKTFLPEQPS